MIEQNRTSILIVPDKGDPYYQIRNYSGNFTDTIKGSILIEVPR